MGWFDLVAKFWPMRASSCLGCVAEAAAMASRSLVSNTKERATAVASDAIAMNSPKNRGTEISNQFIDVEGIERSRDMDDDGGVSPSPSPSPSRSPSPLPVADPVTVAAAPPGHVAVAMPLRKVSPSAGGGGGREDAWSDGATSTLIDAWGERFVALGRGSLRHPQWQEVAEVVSSRDGYSKPPRSDIQCKNRIDTLKKKYKVERAKRGASSWPYFDRLDELLAPVLKPNSSSPSAAAAARTAAPPMVPPRINFPQRTRTPLQPSAGVKRRMPSPPPPQASASSDSSDGFPPEPLPSLANGKRRRVEEPTTAAAAANGAGSSDSRVQGLRDLAQAIRRLGEVYERVEGTKREQELRMEQERLEAARELEDQRVQFFLKMQMELSKATGVTMPAAPMAVPIPADGNGMRRTGMVAEVASSSNHRVRYRIKGGGQHAGRQPHYQNNITGGGSDSDNKEAAEGDAEEEEEESHTMVIGQPWLRGVMVNVICGGQHTPGLDAYSWPYGPRPMGRPKARSFGPTRARPSTTTIGLGPARPDGRAGPGPAPRHGLRAGGGTVGRPIGTRPTWPIDWRITPRPRGLRLHLDSSRVARSVSSRSRSRLSLSPPLLPDPRRRRLPRAVHGRIHTGVLLLPSSRSRIHTGKPATSVQNPSHLLAWGFEGGVLLQPDLRRRPPRGHFWPPDLRSTFWLGDLKEVCCFSRIYAAGHLVATSGRRIYAVGYSVQNPSRRIYAVLDVDGHSGAPVLLEPEASMDLSHNDECRLMGIPEAADDVEDAGVAELLGSNNAPIQVEPDLPEPPSGSESAPPQSQSESTAGTGTGSGPKKRSSAWDHFDEIIEIRLGLICL
ncbi:hypothetical protein HU200_062544 [Digitaria exilis]|uniref:Myb/SANT-like DNA-binding domain-containing protein n=1 Tax=Digitaria exilis TaxID=1010633 RepID=A0A835E0J1_9POAL|nr:hypothetical protein HU200_062544 [Digitaria exilis]